MPLSSFCGLVTLQVGLAIIAAVLFTVAALVGAVNVFDFNNHPQNSFPIPLVLIAVFVILMILSGILMFLAAYQESRKLCMIAVVSIIIVTAYWVVLCCVSFANRPEDLRRVCVYQRCAESFWLANLKYKGVVGVGVETVRNHTVTIETANNNTSRKAFASRINFKDLLPKYNSESVNRRSVEIADTSDEENEAEDDLKVGETKEENVEGKPQYIFGLPMIGAITLFLVNFLFLMFSILILWSYAQELKWADYYDPETTYVVDKSW